MISNFLVCFSSSLWVNGFCYLKGKLLRNAELPGMLNESVRNVTYLGGRVPVRVGLFEAGDTAVAVSRPKQLGLLVDSVLPDFRRIVVFKMIPYCIKFQFVRHM